MTYQDIVCDLTIAADHARFGQVGPKVGSNAFREKRAPDFNRFRI